MRRVADARSSDKAALVGRPFLLFCEGLQASPAIFSASLYIRAERAHFALPSIENPIKTV